MPVNQDISSNPEVELLQCGGSPSGPLPEGAFCLAFILRWLSPAGMDSNVAAEELGWRAVSLTPDHLIEAT